MKIHLTKKEYRLLLDLLYISEWVLLATRIEETEDTKPYKAVLQKLLSFADDYGFSEEVEYAREFEEFMFTRKFEDESAAHRFIDEYDDYTFWDELANRLAQLEMERRHGKNWRQTMDRRKALEELWTIEHEYGVLLEKCGLECLKIADKER